MMAELMMLMSYGVFLCILATLLLLDIIYI